jgi:heptosyltransferase III
MQRGKSINRLIDSSIGIPLLNLLASFRCSRIEPEHPRRVGLLFNPALGDTLLGSAATQEIRSTFPDANLILFAAASNAAAARLLPDVDAIEVLPITRPLQSIRMIRRCGLDMMLDFTAWQRITALYTLLSGARFTVGFERRNQYRHRGYDRTVLHRGDCHELQNLRRLTRSVGSKTVSAPRLLIPDGPLPQAVLRGGRIVIFHAWASGSRSWLREWPDDFWAGLAQSLMAPGRVFLITGAPADEARCISLSRMLVDRGVPAEVLIGRGGIDEIARVLTHAEMLVSVNTGIMHLGAILGVPTVSINGPTAAHRWGPVGPRAENVCPSDGSGGFLDLGFEYRGHSTSVMDRISVADVIHAIHRLRGQSEVAGSATDREVGLETAVAHSVAANEFLPELPHLRRGVQRAKPL